MIISNKHKFIFAHNPKVAGSAIRQTLVTLHDHPIEFWHQAWFREFGRVMDMAHVPLHDLSRILNLSEFQVLVAVRNPYTRFMSSIAEHCRQHDVDLGNDVGLMNQWVHSIVDESRFRFDWKYIHFCPQHYFAQAPRIKVVAFDLPGPAWRGVQRWMKDDLDLEIGELPVVRSSADYKNRFQVSDLDSRSMALINRAYHRDFVAFNYPKAATDSVDLIFDHYDRINSIHHPGLDLLDPSTFTSGELKAYHKKYATR